MKLFLYEIIFLQTSGTCNCWDLKLERLWLYLITERLNTSESSLNSVPPTSRRLHTPWHHHLLSLSRNDELMKRQKTASCLQHGEIRVWLSVRPRTPRLMNRIITYWFCIRMNIYMLLFHSEAGIWIHRITSESINIHLVSSRCKDPRETLTLLRPSESRLLWVCSSTYRPRFMISSTDTSCDGFNWSSERLICGEE